MLTLAGKTLAVPVLQGGMGVGVSLGGLAGAVAACGGMGCISTADTGYREPDFARDPYAANLRALKKEIAKAKEIANGAGLVVRARLIGCNRLKDKCYRSSLNRIIYSELLSFRFFSFTPLIFKFDVPYL